MSSSKHMKKMIAQERENFWKFDLNAGGMNGLAKMELFKKVRKLDFESKSAKNM